jgi:hypothetical protein
VVGDGDTVGVGTEIAQGMLRSSEGSFAVDDPVMAKQLPEPGGEDLGLREEFEGAMEAELALGENALQSGHKLATNTRLSTLLGRKKRAASWDPSRVIGGQTTGREDVMDMGMKLELAGAVDEIKTNERTQGSPTGSIGWRAAPNKSAECIA